MPTKGRSGLAGRTQARTRRVVAAWTLTSVLLLLGQATAVSARTDEVEVAKQSASKRDPLITEALALGLITQADLVAAQSSTPSASLVVAAPTVTTVAPTAGPLKGGQIVAVTGSGFTGLTGASAVQFGDVNATSYALVSSTRVVAKVPDAAAAGAKIIKVTNGDGTNTTGAAYTYGGPAVTSVVPAFADTASTTIVTITGSGFLGSDKTEVKFGALEAKDVWVVSDTQIVASTPIDDNAASPAVVVTKGVTDVKVTRNSVESSTAAGTKFLFSLGAPTITNLGTSSVEVTGTDGVAVGALMTITGTRLWGVSKVNFGNTAVTTASEIVVASDGNTMTVKVPTRTSGPVDVTVEAVTGTSATNLKTRFNYIGTVAPTVTSVTPNVLGKATSGGGGTFLVTGTGFSGVTKDEVTLKCTADVAATSVVVVNDGSLIVTAPGNGGTAEACGLEIVNPVDSTKKVTAAAAIRYV